MNLKVEMEFAVEVEVEVEVLGRVPHKNLLSRRGYCADAEQKLIVYNHIPNLSLHSHLHRQFAGEVQLNWKRSMKIALGSAEGLLYLHHDVYGFGIFLLELHMGQKPIKKLPGRIKRTITEWAESMILKGRFKVLADPKPSGNFDESQSKMGINVVALCVQNNPKKRPIMREAVGLLKGYDPKGKVMKMRIVSVKYGNGLMAMDQGSDEEDGKGYDECSASSAYGVFRPMDNHVQKMQDPYKRYGDGRIAKHV